MHRPPAGWRAIAARRRRALAVVTAALWVLGFELGPALHQATHGALGAHTHDRGAAAFAAGASIPEAPVVRVWRDGEHSHAGVVHRHLARADVERPADDRAALGDGGGDAPHGAHSAAHRDLGFLPPAPALAAPAPVDPPAVTIAHRAPAGAAARPAPIATARGPPARRARA